MSVYDLIFFGLVGIIAAAITLFHNYTIGKPASEFSPYEIFSFYTVWLSKRRLKKVGLLDNYLKQMSESCEDKRQPKYLEIETKNDFKKILYNAADPFFTWERGVGMCPVCTGFWISLIIGLLVTRDIIGIIEIIVISHISIRIFNKIL